MPLKTNHLKPLARPLLLDAVPGAAAAYSLRQLSNAYTGPVVTVRRSSDDAEADFTASEIDDGTLTAFCGAGNGLVKTWHDQSGSGNDASQGTAASQPKIVSSGSLVTEGGKAALEFDGTDDVFNLPSIPEISGTNERSFFFIATAADTSERCVWNSEGGVPGGRLSIGLSNTVLQFRFFAATDTVGPIFPAETNLISYILPAPANNSNLSSAYIFGVQRQLTTDTPLDTVDSHYIGRFALAADYMLGTISELIIYPSDQTATRQLIEGNLAWYY